MRRGFPDCRFSALDYTFTQARGIIPPSGCLAMKVAKRAKSVVYVEL
jgi:hypothetical protein